MKRRKFLGGLGTATALGLSGCVERLRGNDPTDNDSNTNGTTDQDDSTDDDENGDTEDQDDNSNDSGGDSTDDSNDNSDNGSTESGSAEIDFFTTSISCAGEDTDEFASITDPTSTDNTYEFSGRFIVPNTCHDAIADATVDDGVLTVTIQSEMQNQQCEDDCVGHANFAGSLSVDDSAIVEESQIVLP